MDNTVLGFGDSQPTRWERLMERKAESEDLAERSSLFLGFDIDSQTPVCVPRTTLQTNHFHILGRTRAGKTSATLMPLVIQLLQGYIDADGTPSPKHSILILDLKGDQAFFNTTWHAAIRAGQRFRFLSTKKDHDYYFFDPFQMFRLGHMMPIQLAAEFIRAFSLDYGLVYGGLYYTQQNLNVLLKAFEEMLANSSDLKLESLARILHRIGQQQHNRDATHIESCLNLLAAYPQVNITKNEAPPHQNIDMLRAIEDSEVLYYYLEMESEAPALRQVASLALYTMIEAAKCRRMLGLPMRHVYVIVDEFYHIAGTSFGDLLTTVAGLGIHMILANQTRAQLANHDRALPAIVDSNTGVKQIFTLDPDDEEYYRKASGEAIEYRKSFTHSDRSHSVSWTEQIAYYLSDEEVKHVSDTLLSSLMMISDGKPRPPGKRVLKVQGLFPLSEQVYDRLNNTPLPTRPTAPPDFVEECGTHPPDRTTSPKKEWSPAITALDERMQRKWRELDRDG